jgi:hypothetical protein
LNRCQASAVRDIVGDDPNPGHKLNVFNEGLSGNVKAVEEGVDRC